MGAVWVFYVQVSDWVYPVYVGASSSMHMHSRQQGCMHLYREHMRPSSVAS